MVNGQGGTSVFAYLTSLSRARDLVRKVVSEQRAAVGATCAAPRNAVKKVVPNRDDRPRWDWLSGVHCHAVSRTAMDWSFTSNGSVPLRFVEEAQARPA